MYGIMYRIFFYISLVETELLKREFSRRIFFLDYSDRLMVVLISFNRVHKLLFCFLIQL